MRASLSFVLVLSCLVSAAQTVVRDMLSYPLSEEEIGLVAAREAFLEDHQFNSPWLRELDFRVRPNNIETSLSEYRLRFGILNPAEIKANKAYYKLLVSQQEFERAKVINDVLRRRYELILEGYYLQHSRKIVEANLEALNEIKSLVLTQTADLDDILKLEEEITKEELNMRGLVRSMNQLKVAYVNFGVTDLPPFEDVNWVQKEQIDSMIRTVSEDQTMKLISKQYDLAREESILKIDKAEAFSNLGFVQAEYNNDRGDTFDENLRFQLGIQIPIFNTDRPNNQRRELALIEERSEYERLLSTERNEQEISVLELSDYLLEWKLIEAKQAALIQYQEAVQEAGGTVETYDRLRSYTFFLQKAGLRAQLDVLSRYIGILAVAGKLGEAPYHNYLSRDQEIFELN